MPKAHGYRRVDAVDAIDTIDTVDTIDVIDTIDTVDAVDAIDTIDTIDAIDTIIVDLASAFGARCRAAVVGRRCRGPPRAQSIDRSIRRIQRVVRRQARREVSAPKLRRSIAWVVGADADVRRARSRSIGRFAETMVMVIVGEG